MTDHTLHLLDWRCGKPWCVLPNDTRPRPEPRFASSLGGSNCPGCVSAVSEYRRITAAAATAGLSVSPDYARKRWRLGMDSGALRKVVLRAMKREGIAS